MVTMASRTGRQFQRYNKQGCRQVVGCIPYRVRKPNQSPSINGELEVLLISSQKSPKLMFPKGGWEIDESMEDAALRETSEEAGVYGDVESELGNWIFKSQSQSIFHEGHMFALRVTKEFEVWPEQNLRQRIWMSVKEAREVCVHWWMKEALDELVRQLASLQRKEEENGTTCSLEFFRSEESRIGNVASLQRKEEENRTRSLEFLRGEESCSLEFLRREESRIGIVAQTS